MKNHFLVVTMIAASCFLAACATNTLTLAQKKAEVEKALPSLAENLTAIHPDRATMESMFRDYLTAHPSIYGIAFAPPAPAYGKNPKPAIYVYRHGFGFATTELRVPDYDYLNMEWYALPVQRMEAHWTKPYFDVHGGNAWMKTYSIPMLAPGKPGSLYGVVTSDLKVPPPSH